MTNSITFLLGAGFSAPFGVPTMRPFLQSFQSIAKRKYPDLYETLEMHFSRLPEDSDLEALLSSLGSAESLGESLPPNSTVNAELLDWQSKSRILKAHLVSYIIERCERFDRELAAETLSPFIRKLTASSPLQEAHFFTTNYDRILESVCELLDVPFSDGFSGTTQGLVAPWTRDFHERVRLYKLHGSVTYYVDRESENEPEFLRLDRGYPLPGPDFRLSRDGRDLEPLMILPTLEKDALSDPYGHLGHLFAETMSKTKLVVAIGTSLRDSHLVSALNYNADNIVLLIVDTDPGGARVRVPNLACVTLKASARDFLTVSSESLVNLFEACLALEGKEERAQMVEQFAEAEASNIAHWLSMTKEQRAALNAVKTPQENPQKVLDAIRLLHGVADSTVVSAIAEKCQPQLPANVRKAAVGCLGLSGNPSAVVTLEAIASSDLSSDVRLEAYLALDEFGTEESERAINSARAKWPSDAYFSDSAVPGHN